jgi:hypothetical protein
MSLRDYLSRGTPESSKRLIAFVAAVVLCLSVIVLVESIAYQAHRNWAIDNALSASLIFVGGIVAGLAGVAYTKPDDKGEPKP